ncbi:MAG: amidase, partial [Candidatus Dormibacteraeota bacterium]|nr:amidase [Candidatus Dormibacteraeota bacterium]
SGGSIRVPAACCGVVGVKATPGVVPWPVHWYGLSSAGPFARDVEDAALMLRVLRGGTRAAPPAAADSDLRIAVSTRHPFPGARVDATVASAVQRTAHRLAGAGHHVAHADPPYPQVPAPFLRCYLGGIADDDDALFVDAARAEPRTRAMAAWERAIRRLGPGRRAQTYPAARRLRRWFDLWDVVITPALAYAPPLIGRWQNEGWLSTAIGVSRWIGFSPLWNLAGCPAATVPVGSYRDGMPVAVQIVAAPGRERLLMAVAAQIEALSEGRLP